MRTEKEINLRMSKVSGFIELSKEIGQVNPTEINKLKKELRILDWVLGANNLNRKNIISSISHVQDSIIVFLRDEKEPVPFSEIRYNVGKTSSGINIALSTLVKAERIQRFGEPRKYLYSIDNNELSRGVPK